MNDSKRVAISTTTAGMIARATAGRGWHHFGRMAARPAGPADAAPTGGDGMTNDVKGCKTDAEVAREDIIEAACAWYRVYSASGENIELYAVEDRLGVAVKKLEMAEAALKPEEETI